MPISKFVNITLLVAGIKYLQIYFQSLVVQIYLAGLAIANSFEKTVSDC